MPVFAFVIGTVDGGGKENRQGGANVVDAVLSIITSLVTVLSVLKFTTVPWS